MRLREMDNGGFGRRTLFLLIGDLILDRQLGVILICRILCLIYNTEAETADLTNNKREGDPRSEAEDHL